MVIAPRLACLACMLGLSLCFSSCNHGKQYVFVVFTPFCRTTAWVAWGQRMPQAITCAERLSCILNNRRMDALGSMTLER